MDNIVYAHGVGVIGGAERVSLSVIEGVVGRYQPHLIAPASGELLEEAEKRGAICHPLSCIQPEWTKPCTTLGHQLKLYRLLKALQPKLIHTGDILVLRSMQVVCRWLKIPIICHVHFPYDHAFANWVFKNRPQPKGFIFCSQELQNNIGPLLQQHCPQAIQKTIHNGIDLSAFTPGDKLLSAEIPRVGMIANLQRRKGHDEFLQMANLLQAQGFKAQFDIIGGDILQQPREPILRQLALELEIADSVTFHGQLSDVKSALRQLDVVVCASHEEAFPISMLEAMACERAIVSTDVNGIPEALTHNQNALLTSPYNAEGLADHVATLLRNPEKARALAVNARDTVVNNFSLEVFHSKIQSFYEDVT